MNVCVCGCYGLPLEAHFLLQPPPHLLDPSRRALLESCLVARSRYASVFEWLLPLMTSYMVEKETHELAECRRHELVPGGVVKLVGDPWP